MPARVNPLRQTAAILACKKDASMTAARMGQAEGPDLAFKESSPRDY